MSVEVWPELGEAWGLPGAATLVARGENETWRLGDHAVRVYRPGRWARPVIEAEWSWVEALWGVLDTPAPLRGRDGAVVQELADGRFAAAVEWVEGEPPALETPAEAERLGQLLRRLADACGRTLAVAPPGWVGRRRDAPTAHQQVDRTVEHLDAATFATAEQKHAVRVAADRLRAALEAVPLAPDAFVHGDAHRWNLLQQGERWWLIDFDDAFFAPAETELATIRTHWRAEGRLARLEPALLRGWGDHDPRRLAAACALHVFDTIGVFPSHLDVGSLATDPGAVLDRYLGYLDAELRPLGV